MSSLSINDLIALGPHVRVIRTQNGKFRKSHKIKKTQDGNLCGV